MKLINTLLKVGKDNAPNILTGIAVTGVVVTTILAIKAGPKLKEHASIARNVKKEMDQENFPVGEIRKQSVKNGLVYLKDLTPTIIAGTVTISCVLGVNKIMSDRNAALLAAYKLADISRKELITGIGEEQATKIVKDDMKSRYNDIPPMYEGHGDILCYEAYSKRYFLCTRDRVHIAEMKANERLARRGECSLNYFYGWLGIEPIPLANNFGWTTYPNDGYSHSEGLDWINFRHDSFVVNDYTSVLMIDYSVDSIPDMM